jgi:photosystem II stability/assembly factor-like uncharacterized protein
MKCLHLVIASCVSLALVTLTACGSQEVPGSQQATSDSPTPTDLQGPRVENAELVTSQVGWARSGSAVEVTTDQGSHWNQLALPAEPISGHAVSLNDQQITALGVQQGHVHIFKSTITGGSWRDAADLGEVRSLGSADLETTTSGPAGVLITLQSSANFSPGLYFGTSDGQTWIRRDVPSGGDLTLSPDGSTAWIAGGAINDELYRSTDNGKTWDRVELPISDLPVGGTVAISPPEVMVDGTIVIPVTTHAPNETTTVRFMVAQDNGATFTQAAKVSVEAVTSDGVRIPTSVLADAWIILEPAANRVYTLSAQGGQPTVVSPNGILPGITGITFATTTIGWATVDYATCEGAKGNCSEYRLLYETTDGGQTWTRLQVQ